VGRFALGLLQGGLLQIFVDLHGANCIRLNFLVVFVDFQRAAPQSLLPVLVGNHALVVLDGVRDVRVVRVLVLLHLTQELAVVRFRGRRLQVSPERIEAREGLPHVLARVADARVRVDRARVILDLLFLLLHRVQRHNRTPVRHRGSPVGNAAGLGPRRRRHQRLLHNGSLWILVLLGSRFLLARGPVDRREGRP